MNIDNNILIINGPNLNLLGTRETNYYGNKNLNDLELFLQQKIKQYNFNFNLCFFQSNYEGDIINKIHNATKHNIVYFIINPGALTHSSIVLRDALLAVNIPFIEVHITNIFSRESFRLKSYISDIATGIICGLGFNSYFYALKEIFYKLSIGKNK